MDPQAYREEIEHKILLALQEHLQNGDMDEQRAQEIARTVLEVLRPEMSLDQIYTALPQLSLNFVELAQVLNPIIQEHDKQVKQVITQHVKKLVSQGKIDEATKILKEVNHHEKQE